MSCRGRAGDPRGEAGIDAWLDAVKAQFPDWRMHISSRLTDSEYAAGHALDAVRGRANTAFDDCLHLAVSMRSFRAENVSSFVKCVLDHETRMAAEAYEWLKERNPIVVTRELSAAKQWVRAHARGSERYGLVASSKAQRLKPHAIDIRVDVDPVSYLGPRRSALGPRQGWVGCRDSVLGVWLTGGSARGDQVAEREGDRPASATS